MNLQNKILLVDDDPDHLSMVEMYAAAMGLPFTVVTSAREAITYLQKNRYDIMVTDIVMPDMDGMQLLKHCREHHPEVDVICMTGFSQTYSYMDVIEAGAADFIAKPFQKDEFEARVCRLLLERAQLRDLRQAIEMMEKANKAKIAFLNTTNHELNTSLNGIVGFARLLLAMDLPKKQRELLREIYGSAEQFLSFTRRALDHASLDSREDAPPTSQRNILLVDDDPDHLSMVEMYASAMGLPFTAVTSAREAITYLQKNRYDIMVTDMVMPDMDGMQLLKHCRDHHPEIDVICMTGFSRSYSYMDVIKAGAADYIVKPFPKDEFEARLFRLLMEMALRGNLHQAKKQTEEDNRVQTVFLDTISHEISTPLQSIVGASRSLSKLDLPEEPREFLRAISESADRLERTTNQLLAFASLTSQELDLQPSEFEVNAFVSTIAPPLNLMAGAKGLPLLIAIDPAMTEHKFYGDTTVLAKILDHLVSNAVKFSEHGEIKIAVQASERPTPDSILLQFSVTDHGCGVGSELAESIFAPFAQADDYSTRRHSGLGLGLAICAKLVQLLRGRIWVESEEGQGSTFFFTARCGVI